MKWFGRVCFAKSVAHLPRFLFWKHGIGYWNKGEVMCVNCKSWEQEKDTPIDRDVGGWCKKLKYWKGYDSSCGFFMRRIERVRVEGLLAPVPWELVK